MELRPETAPAELSFRDANACIYIDIEANTYIYLHLFPIFQDSSKHLPQPSLYHYTPSLLSHNGPQYLHQAIFLVSQYRSHHEYTRGRSQSHGCDNGRAGRHIPLHVLCFLNLSGGQHTSTSTWLFARRIENPLHRFGVWLLCSS
jgi:hypothetical protein